MATPQEDFTQVEDNSATRSPMERNLEYGDGKHLQQDVDEDSEFSHQEQRRIVHHIDRRLVTMTGVIYMVSLMDRSNLPNAAIAGMNIDLDLNTGFRYVRALPP